MSTLPVPRASVAGLPSAVQVLRVFAFNLLAWSLLSTMGAGSASSQLASQAGQAAYLEIFCESWKTSLMQAVVGAVLYTLLSRWPALLLRSRSLASLYFVTLLLFVPVDVLYRAAWAMSAAGAVAPQVIGAALQEIPRFNWFFDFVLLSCTFAVQASLCIWRQGQERARALELADKENLRLRLELEQLRILGLRAQLEPHFLFNALNAISALVRADDRKAALTGIGRLSGLLRYALTASAREWVSIGDELAFVQDYLALQQLRYGARLKISIEIVDDTILAAACPPLLLQPLVENALRHDLDCHGGSSDICLRFSNTERELHISVSNPMPHQGGGHGVGNPGLGLGLRHTSASLQHAFGPPASLGTRTHEGRFIVELRLPLQSCG